MANDNNEQNELNNNNNNNNNKLTWYPPSPITNMIDYYSIHYPLRVYNSLTRSKVPFVPMFQDKSKPLLWYMCGPTVYDQTHLGHGRTYTCFDYIRRILEDYFNYNIHLVMNITDIDDKIILRAAENGYKEYLETNPIKKNEFNLLDENNKKKIIMEWSSMEDPILIKKRTENTAAYWENSFFNDIKLLNIQLPTEITRVSEYINEIIECINRIIQNGYAYIINHSVYFDTIKFSNSKNKKYGKLVPENVNQLQENINDTNLLQEGEGVLTNLQENIKNEKKHPSDFALWKKSKKGEPSWSSIWGEGRPGWHIECSAMAAETLKQYTKDNNENYHFYDNKEGRIDIHSGGIDLRFPHHDNEIAQSEAYFNNNKQWINYFLHTGHLNIKGLKMSKSLKNFIKIENILELYNYREIRILFLLHKYNNPMDYDDNTMDEACNTYRIFFKFFQILIARLRYIDMYIVNDINKTNSYKLPQKWEIEEKELNSAIQLSKNKTHIALCDDFDTRSVILVLVELMKELLKYITTKKKDKQVKTILLTAGLFITKIIRIFGLCDDTSTSLNSYNIGFTGISFHIDIYKLNEISNIYLNQIKDLLTNRKNMNNDKKDIELLLINNNKTKQMIQDIILNKNNDNKYNIEKIIDLLSTYRDEIRSFSIKNIIDKDNNNKLLNVSDELRDEWLPTIGICLEDFDTNTPSEWYYDNPIKLIQEKNKEKQEKLLKEENKRKKIRENEKKLNELKEKLKIKPEFMFKNETDKYSKFDDKGIPTHNAQGEPLSKSLIKKLIKDQEKHKKLIEKNQSILLDNNK